MSGPAHANPYPGTVPYSGRGEYGEMADGGHYAYVIRADDEIGPSPVRPRRAADHTPNPHQRSGPNQQAPRQPLGLGPAPVAHSPGTAPGSGLHGIGSDSEAGEPQPGDPALPYGPDDPDYGPPSPDWYERAEEARRHEVEEELRQARGAFEPLPPDHVVTAPDPPGEPAGAQDPGTVLAGESADDTQGKLAGDLDEDLGDDLDVALLGRGAEPLEGIKDLYLTAETIGDRRLDKHFEQLLERQRELISEFFTKAELRVPAGPGGQEGLDGPESERLSFGGAGWSRR